MDNPLILAIVIALVLITTIIVILSRYKKCPSDKIMVIYGKVGSNPDGSSRSATAIAAANSKPDAATEAAKAAGLGGATTLSAPVSASSAKTAEKADAKASKDKAEKDKKEAAKAAKAEKKAPEMKDGPPKVALAQPPAAKPGSDAKAAPAPAAAEPTKTAEAPKPKKPLVGGVDRPYLYNELVAAWSAIEQAAGEAGVIGSQAQLDI